MGSLGSLGAGVTSDLRFRVSLLRTGCEVGFVSVDHFREGWMYNF